MAERMHGGKMPSVMAHEFSRVPQAEIERSSFDRSHGYKTTLNSGYLVPFFVDEALPGDTFNCHATIFMRLQTPIHPFMDNMFADTFFFAVPVRLLWANWEKMNGRQNNPGDSTVYAVPKITAPIGGYAVMDVHDYFGLPTGLANYDHSALWDRAYNLIFNEWFRDENLQNSVVVKTDDGPDTPGDCVLLRRGKRHDYFTSCLPWPQKGTAVSLPLGTTAPVKGIGIAAVANAAAGVNYYETGGTTIASGTWGRVVDTNMFFKDVINATGTFNTGGHYPNIYVDLTSATAATINDLRTAFQTQRLLERDARGGTRYTEVIKAHFGVTSPDARLQRPEYLGGGSTPVNVTPVPQTSVTAGTPQGNLAAFGTASSSTGFVKAFTEHCVLLGLVSVRADLSYQQGLNRMWSRRTRYDFYWPALAHLGEQAVLNKEIYCNADANDPLTFGYQERYAEYRYKPSQITGKFRSNAAGTLDSWHLAQKFVGLPTLNSTFIQDTPPVSRIVAVTTDPEFYMDAYFDMKCVRPMPVFGVPGLIDHF